MTFTVTRCTILTDIVRNTYIMNEWFFFRINLENINLTFEDTDMVQVITNEKPIPLPKVFTCQIGIFLFFDSSK